MTTPAGSRFRFIALLPLWLMALWVMTPQVHAASPRIMAGPMLGYSDFRQVAVWVQLDGPAQVAVDYRRAGQTGKMTRLAARQTGEAHIVTLEVYPLEPGQVYDYQIVINGRPVPVGAGRRQQFRTQALWQFRTEPPEFTLATGSCAFINDSLYDRPRPYGSNYKIFEAMSAARPELMLWLGDNAYYREVDFYTRNGLIYRQTHTRRTPELANLLASTHHYAIWDDHDYGPNDASRAYTQKTDALDVWKMFWPNPSYGVPGGCAGSAFWGDVHMILLDDRWWRAPNTDTSKGKDYFGQAQLQWLTDQLHDSPATFKIIANGGQLLNPAPVFENLAAYPKERERLLEAISRSGASGVILLSGDRHHTELTKLDRPGTYPLYELTCSSLTAGVAPPANYEVNNLRVEGTLLVEHNFALLTFTGTRKERKLRMSIRGVDGQEKWSRELTAAELMAPRRPAPGR